MEIERWHQIKNLFYSVLEVEMSERDEFLKRACEGDAELLQEVQSLLSAHEQPGSFLEKPAFELGMQMLKDEHTSGIIHRDVKPLLKRQDRLREAEERASRVSHFAAVGGNSTQKVKSSFLLASILYAEGNKDSLYYENQALTLAEDFHCEELVPRGLIEIGEMFRSKHKLSEAKTRFQTALAKAGSANLIYSKANALYALGQLYLQQNYPNESIPLFEEVLRIEFPDNSYSGDAPFHWRNSILNMEYQSAIRMFREKFRFARRS